MVFEKKRPLGEFHPSMEQVEEGLYRAAYSGEVNPQIRMKGKFPITTSAPASPM